MGSRSLLKWAAYGSLVLTAVVMWYPARSLHGINLASHALQTSMFALNAFLFAIVESGRPLRRSPFDVAGGLNEIAAVRWRRHVVRVAILCVFFAALLEIGQLVAPTRHAGVTGLAENIGSILLTTGLVYASARILLSNHRIRRLALGQLSRAADSFRSETHYAGLLRDTIQEAYAISFAELPADERLAKISVLLSAALGVEPPIHDEGLLTSAFGARRAPDASAHPAVNADDVQVSNAGAREPDGPAAHEARALAPHGADGLAVGVRGDRPLSR